MRGTTKARSHLESIDLVLWLWCAYYFFH